MTFKIVHGTRVISTSATSEQARKHLKTHAKLANADCKDAIAQAIHDGAAILHGGWYIERVRQD